MSLFIDRIINRIFNRNPRKLVQISEDVFILVKHHDGLVYCQYLPFCTFVNVPLIILLKKSDKKFIVIG